MVLDARLKKLATGTTAAEVTDAAAKSMRAGELEKLSDTQKQQAQEFLATVEAMFLMAAVDGHISGSELEQLAASIQAIIDMHAAPGLNIESTLEELNEKLARDGWRSRLERVGERIQTPDGRAFAFRLAAGVAFVDDHVAHAEAAAIDAFAGALGLDRDESQDILHEVHDELFGDG
jgi:tellurite resistance protein